MWSRILVAMYLGGRKLKSFPMWGRICVGVAMHLEMKRKLDSFPMWGKDLQRRIAVHVGGKIKKPLNSFLLWEGFVGEES